MTIRMYPKYDGVIINSRVFAIVERILASQSVAYRNFYNAVRDHFEVYPERTVSSELILSSGIVLPFKEYIIRELQKDTWARYFFKKPEESYLDQRVTSIISRIDRDATRQGRGASPEERTKRCRYCGTVVPVVSMHRSLRRYGSDRTGIKICSGCYEKELEEERSTMSEKNWNNVKRYEEVLQECELGKTCGVITAHQKGLCNDPERLRSTFLIGMTCGIDGLRKYLIKRGDITKAQSDSMSDESLEEYININDL